MTKRKRNTRRKKKKTGLAGALLLEFLAVILILVLFAQARAQRHAESEIKNQPVPALTDIFEQTPFKNLLVQNGDRPRAF